MRRAEVPTHYIITQAKELSQEIVDERMQKLRVEASKRGEEEQKGLDREKEIREAAEKRRAELKDVNEAVFPTFGDSFDRSSLLRGRAPVSLTKEQVSPFQIED